MRHNPLTAAAGATALAAALTLPVVGSSPDSRTWVDGPATTAAQLTSYGFAPCTAPLSRGRAVVTRSTGRVSDGAARYWTSITLTSTGDPFLLVVNRGVGQDPISRVIVRAARGITGTVGAGQTRSWGFHSRDGHVVASVAGVDQATGRIFNIAGC